MAGASRLLAVNRFRVQNYIQKMRPAKASLIKGQIGTMLGQKAVFFADCPGTLWDTYRRLRAFLKSSPVSVNLCCA